MTKTYKININRVWFYKPDLPLEEKIPKNKWERILASFTLGELDNPFTRQSIVESLDKEDKEYAKLISGSLTHK